MPGFNPTLKNRLPVQPPENASIKGIKSPLQIRFILCRGFLLLPISANQPGCGPTQEVSCHYSAPAPRFYDSNECRREGEIGSCNSFEGARLVKISAPLA